MLGVGLRKLCPQGSFDYAFRERRKLYEHRPPEGAKSARWGSKMASGRPPDGSCVPVGPNLAAKAAQKPSLGGSGGALGTLLALLEPSWGLLGRSWGVPGRSWAPLEGRVGPSRPIFGPKRRPRGFPGRFWSNFGSLREALEAEKHRKIRCFCCISRCATENVQII